MAKTSPGTAENKNSMIRGLDHIVHVVSDLAAAGAAYERLGFQVGAENVHPWDTRNRLVQIPGFYIELLSIPESVKLPPQPTQSYSFGAFNREFLQACGEGLSSLALQSSDPKAEAAEFDKAGFGGFEVVDFARKGKRHDGSEIEVAFSLAFARDPASPHAGFFTCLHGTPERIWFLELQRHHNGARSIAAAVLVAENPTDHHIFLEAFSGARDVRATSLGLRIETPHGEILTYDPRAFVDSFGTAPSKDEGLRLAALVFTVADLAATGKWLETAGLRPRELHNRLVVGPDGTCGAVIAFESA
jgi:catechol 2,3-dioxygenase-like lactoylglutathione lyase family enzyme